MTRAELDAAHAAVIRKWARTITDMTGPVPRGLLDDLAAVAGEHAAGRKPPRRAAAAEEAQ